MRHSTANWAISLTLGAASATDAPMSSTISSSASFSLKILTALTGSPTYFGSANRTVLTSPSSRSRRQGVIRGLSISEFSEILQEPRSEVVALFRMELHAVDVAGVRGGCKVAAVVGDREPVFVTLAHEVEGMQKVESRAGVELVKQAVGGDGPDVVPAHMRPRKRAARMRLERPHARVDPPEARQLAFVAAVREHLHADAHAKHRDPLPQRQLIEGVTHARPSEAFHRIVERSDA